MRIFVYRPGAIGDTVLTLPALACLQAGYPGCAITYAGNDAMLPLLPVSDALRADDPRLLPLFANPPRAWRPFDLEVSFSRLPFGVQRDPLGAIAAGAHMADWLVDAIDPSFRDRVPHLPVAGTQGVDLVLHIGAGSAAKRWPADQFHAVLSALSPGSVALICGPADEEAAAEFLAISGPRPEVWRGLDLADVAGRLAASRLFIGNDSGITHLAAAIGVPTAALYVSTDPMLWGIRGRRTRRLAGAAITAAAVVQAARELLAG